VFDDEEAIVGMLARNNRNNGSLEKGSGEGSDVFRQRQRAKYI